MTRTTHAQSDARGLLLGPLRQRMLSGGIWALGARLASGGLGVLVSVLHVRLLPPQEVGAFFLGLSVVTVASMLARGGLEKTVLALAANRLGNGDEIGARRIIGRVFLLAAFSISVAAALLGLFVTRWLATELFSSAGLMTIAALTGPWVFTLAFDTLFAETFRGLHDIARASIFGGLISRAVTATVLVALLVVSGQASLVTIVLIAIASGAISLLIAAFELHRKLRPLHAGEGRRESVRSIVNTSMPLLVSNLTLFAMSQADIWVIGAFRSEQEVAVYAVAARLVLIVGMSLAVVNAVLPPVIGELNALGHKKKLERVVRSTTTLAALPSATLLLVFILMGGLILEVAFGEYYGMGATVLALLSLGQLANVLVGSCGYVLIMTGHQSDLMRISTLSGTISVVGGVAAVNQWGATGVAAAVMTGVMVQQALMLFYARRRAGIWTHVSAALIGPSLSTAVAAARGLAGRTGDRLP